MAQSTLIVAGLMLSTLIMSAAVEAIVEEAGGRFTGLDGKDGCWSGNALATNGLLHEVVLERLGTAPGTDG